jgi:peptidoglycan/LPS O-acetylase OafA/YrhL
MVPLGGALVLQELLLSLFLQPAKAGAFAVDTFFILSAFLATYLFVEGIQKRSNTTSSSKEGSGEPARQQGALSWIGLAYLNRYLRLTPVYFVTLMYYGYIHPLSNQGPFWPGENVRFLLQ